MSCPRRFGKSLLVSTMESYFQGKKELFQGLAIENLEKDWNAYPVLHLDLSGVTYTEEKVLDAAAAMKESGLVDAGYVYLNMDDCWQSSMRDPETGSMMFDLDNFPSGPELVDKLHDMGLKVGVYSLPGELTCEDLPGSYGNEAVDARAFAEWGIDYLKYDYCHVVDLSSDPEGGSDFSGLTSAPDVDYISLTKYTGSDGASGDKVQIEAESDEVERTGNVTVQSSGSCSGGQYVTGLGSNGGSLIFKNVNAPEDGTYILTIGYRKTYSLRGRYAEVLVNDSDRYEAHVSRSSGWSLFSISSMKYA